MSTWTERDACDDEYACTGRHAASPKTELPRKAPIMIELRKSEPTLFSETLARGGHMRLHARLPATLIKLEDDVAIPWTAL